MVQRPSSLPAFEAQFPDDEACARWLFEKRWPEGFRCPGCGHDHGWELDRGLLLVECAGCHRQTSVTAGTVLHRSHLPLRLWFLAAWLVATHRNGISARQLWLQLGLGSYKTAWLLLRKLRRAMVDPGREPLAGLVEVDETSIPFRTREEPVAAKPGRSHQGKLLIAGAVEIKGKGPGRVRLVAITSYSAESLGGFVKAARSPAAARSSATAGPATPRSRTSGTIPRWSGPWPRTSCCPGSIASSPTPSAGASASVTACAGGISRPASTSSPSASIDAMRPLPPSSACSALPSLSSQPPTRR